MQMTKVVPGRETEEPGRGIFNRWREGNAAREHGRGVPEGGKKEEKKKKRVKSTQRAKALPVWAVSAQDDTWLGKAAVDFFVSQPASKPKWRGVASLSLSLVCWMVPTETRWGRPAPHVYHGPVA